MNKPCVSVVIPTYNRAKWLPRAMQSVQKQRYEHWELLIVDDASTDETEEIVSDAASSDARLRYLRNNRKKGVSGARNTGIDHARLDYVAFLDSDDEWHPHHLSDCLDVLHAVDEGHMVDGVVAQVERRRCGTGELFGSRKKFGEDIRDANTGRLSNSHLFQQYLAGSGPLEIQTLVMRRESIGNTRFDEDLKMGEDGFFFMEFFEANRRFVGLDSVHATMWAHDSNSTAAGGRKLTDSEMLAMYEALELFGEKILRRFKCLSTNQRNNVLKGMSDTRFWEIGYRTYLKSKNYQKARDSFVESKRWHPWNFTKQKTYWLSYVRQILRL